MIFKTANGNITSRELLLHVERFLQEELPRRQKLMDYYRGQQGVYKGMAAQGRPDNRLVSNYAKYITDVHTGYFMGLPPTLTFERRRVQDRMGRALEEASFGRMLYAAARDMSICGEGYLLAYLTAEGPRLARLSPLETFFITRGVSNAEAAAVRVYSSEGERVRGELYVPGRRMEWEMHGRLLTLGSPEKLPFADIPVIRFCNNLDGSGDFEPVTSLLDAYNVLLSGAMDDMQSVANAFLALYGAMGTTQEDIDRANRSRVLCMADNGRAEFVVKKLSPDTIELLKGTLVNDLLSITMTPNLQDDAFAGNSSGVALEYKLWGIEQARSAKEQGFSGGLYHIIGLFYQALRVLGVETGGSCAARFYKNLPQDVSRICTDLKTLGDTLSHHTRLEMLPFVKDAEAEMERIRQEKEDA